MVAGSNPSCHISLQCRFYFFQYFFQKLFFFQTFFQDFIRLVTHGLCLVLRRLAYPCRLSDLVRRFGPPEPEMSMILFVVTFSTLVYDAKSQQTHAHLRRT